MSAFDEYYVKPLEKYDDTIDYYGKDDLKDAFEAGLEAAAQLADADDTDCINARDHYGCTQGAYIAESIRALKEQT